MFKRTSLMALIVGCIAFTTVPAPEAEAAGYKSKSSSRSYSSSGYKSKASVNSSRGFGKSGPYTRPKAATPYTASQPMNGAKRSTQHYPPHSVNYRKPTTYKPTVVQKNYYNTSNYNRGGSYGGGYGGGSGVGMGGAILGGAAGAVGGMMLMDALTEDEGEKALKLQQEQKIATEAKEEQARDDKLDQVLENQKEAEQREMIPEPSNDFFKVDPRNMQ